MVSLRIRTGNNFITLVVLQLSSCRDSVSISLSFRSTNRQGKKNHKSHNFFNVYLFQVKLQVTEPVSGCVINARQGIPSSSGPKYTQRLHSPKRKYKQRNKAPGYESDQLLNIMGLPFPSSRRFSSFVHMNKNVICTIYIFNLLWSKNSLTGKLQVIIFKFTFSLSAIFTL